jgi:acyl-CoA thioester hydrolase
MARSDFAFSYRFRVRWSEVDPQGVVFNARYLDYADIAITEYYRAVGFRELHPDEPLEFHVKRAVVTWSAPIESDEMIDVMARTVRSGTTSMIQVIEIHGANDDCADDLRAEIELVNVHVDLSTHRPVPLPNWLAPAFAAFDSRTPG